MFDHLIQKNTEKCYERRVKGRRAMLVAAMVIVLDVMIMSGTVVCASEIWKPPITTETECVQEVPDADEGTLSETFEQTKMMMDEQTVVIAESTIEVSVPVAYADSENVEGYVTSERNIRNTETLVDMRGVWVAFVDYKDMGLYNKSEVVFRANASKMFKKLKNDNINTVFFHVVPCNDAIYPSEYLKWSKYMFKKAPKYDPLQILIELAHENDISFHAWINPYRKKMGVSFNPGKESSIDRVLDIVNEIIDNYDVDGIHMDDYFYPSNGQFKNVSVKKRKKNVNNMIRQVYQTIKETDEDIMFGISPAGSITYAESIGCDLETWMSKDGYIDYIVPQIYWSDNYILSGKKTKLYTQRLKQWMALDRNDTPMIIGLALYRAGTGDSFDKGWKKKNNIIVSQIKQEKAAGCQGFVLFSARFMYNKSGKKEMNNYRKYYGITN